MKVSLDVKKTENVCKGEITLVFPELMSLESISEHILWEDIILPEIITISGSVVVKCSVKSEFSYAELLNIEFEEAKYKKIEIGEYFNKHAKGGFYRIKSAKAVSLLTGIDTFIHKDEDDEWRVTESITGTSLGGSTTRRGDALNEAQATLKRYGYKKMCELIIKEAGDDPSPRYEVQSNLVNT